SAPMGKKIHKRYSGGKVIKTYSPGNLKKSIGIRNDRNRETPTVYVAPLIGKKRKYDGYYAHMVHGGTRHMKSNPFMDRAFSSTKGQVTSEAEKKVAEQIQKQINKLSS